MGPKSPFPSDSQTSFKVAVAGDGRGIRLVRSLLLLVQLTLIGHTSASKHRIPTCHQNLLDNPGLWRCDWKSEGDFCISIAKGEKVTVCLVALFEISGLLSIGHSLISKNISIEIVSVFFDCCWRAGCLFRFSGGKNSLVVCLSAIGYR
jgi:hypothetical protein